MNNDSVVVKSNKEEIKKLEKRLKVSNTLMSASSTGFIVTLLSPFDFEGPVAEIACAASFAAGAIMKKATNIKLEALRTNGESYEEFGLSTEDKNDSIQIAKYVKDVINKRNEKKNTL